MTKKIDHIHKYQRTTLGRRKYPIYRCMTPGCTHYVDATLILNRICECWRCGKAMVIGKYAARLAKPHCDDCIKKDDSDRINKIGELFTDA